MKTTAMSYWEQKTLILSQKSVKKSSIVETNCLNGLNIDLKVAQDQILMLQSLCTQQSKLLQASGMITALKSQFSIESAGGKNPDTFTIEVNKNQQTFINQVLKENLIDNRFLNSQVTINDLAYFSGLIEGWIGAGDMHQQDINSQAQFISKQYNAQLQLIDKLINSIYDIFSEVIQQIN